MFRTRSKLQTETQPNPLTPIVTAYRDTARQLLSKANREHRGYDARREHSLLNDVAHAWLRAATYLVNHGEAVLADVKNAAHYLERAAQMGMFELRQQALDDARTYLYAASVSARISQMPDTVSV